MPIKIAIIIVARVTVYIYIFFSDVKNVLDSIGVNITHFSKMIPILHVISNLTSYITQSEMFVREYYPVVEQYDFYRYHQLYS